MDQSQSEKKYQEFQEKVKRTVCIASISPQVTPPIVTTAFSQFGTVKSVLFVQNGRPSRQCALVEMENSKQAEVIIADMTVYPFMMCGMPRPVRVYPAKPDMYVDRPPKPAHQVQVKWMDPEDPDFRVAMKIKDLTEKHRLQASWLLKCQMEKEEKLHNHQEEMLKANHRKLEMVGKLRTDGTIDKLARGFNLRIVGDY